ncbi:hypothetical protein ACGC1H_006201 [Rhizoctonia solani]|uniref:Uncharacterized protein n=1 Tax=Rhizoctonia solani TaxID=456999 RepID=A0A8H3H015_9AGAM|nr:unnamed protein product [Rhizoctonia solani]
MQTKQVEYYRAAPTGPGMSYSVDLERVSPPRVRPGRSPSDPPAPGVAPLSISKRVKSPPAHIVVPELARPPRSPARMSGQFDPPGPPAPGPPPAGPLPPVPREEPMDPLLLRAVGAKERRRQSKNAEGDLASLERSMRRLSRISLASGEPASPTDSLAVSSPSMRAEKLLRRLSRQNEGVRLPADYGRVGISGYSVPSSPGVREEALSVPMRRVVPLPNNLLGLGLGLAPSDSFASMSSLTSASSMSDDTLSTLPSEATIKPLVQSETRTTRIGSLSSATTASTSSLVTPVSPPTTHTLLLPMSPPRPLKLKGSLQVRIPSRSPSPGPSPLPDLLRDYRDSVYHSYEAANRESSIFPASYRGLAVPSRPTSRSPSPVAPTRQRPGARARVHSDLAPPSPTEHVLDMPPMRPSLEAQITPTPKSCSPDPARPASPDIAYILRTTPRPTRKTSVGSLASSTAGRRLGGAAPPSAFRPVPSRSGSLASVPSRSSSSAGMTYAATASSAGFDDGSSEVFFGQQYDSDDSDSDLDLTTPLPHMMLRAGLLSPRSTIITESLEPTPVATKLSARGEALRARGEKVWKAETRRKIRHRDGQNLRDGVGLTTGLGWSDSEDEDAPSPLRRRLSSVLLAKAQSRPPSQLSRQSNLSLSRRSTFSNLESSSVSSASNPRTPAHPPMSLPPSSYNPPAYAHTLPLTPGSLPQAAAVDEFGKLDFPMPPTATSWRGQPSPGLRKPPSIGMLRSASTAGSASASLLRSRTVSSTSSQGASQGHSPRASTTSARTSRGSVASQRSMMPAPRFNVRPPAVRLSAPEVLRQSQSAETRRLSGS